jgi:hypothetical protein
VDVTTKPIEESAAEVVALLGYSVSDQKMGDDLESRWGIVCDLHLIEVVDQGIYSTPNKSLTKVF